MYDMRTKHGWSIERIADYYDVSRGCIEYQLRLMAKERDSHASAKT
jgi:hypothetical protein